MQTGPSRLALSAVVLAAVALTACAKKPAPAPPPAPAPVNQDSIDAARARADSIARAEQARRDSIARAQAEADRMRAGREAAVNALQAKVYFAYDSAALTDTAKAVLDAKIGVLNANPSVTLRVEGNTDERGSEEYNLALGQRRAAAAKRYLTDHGIADSRITIISYGEERPVATGHDEASWSQNRRDEFEITAGSDSIKGSE